MKKLPILVSAFLFLAVLIGTTACGPSKEEQQRLDSIRVADSLHKVDSIRIVDSLAQARKAEQEATALRDKIDQEAAALKGKHAVKFYDLHKIVYMGRQGGFNDGNAISKVCIKDVATGDVKTISLPHSEDYDGIWSIDQKGAKKVIVGVPYGGSAPLYADYTIDVEKGKITNIRED